MNCNNEARSIIYLDFLASWESWNSDDVVYGYNVPKDDSWVKAQERTKIGFSLFSNIEHFLMFWKNSKVFDLLTA